MKPGLNPAELGKRKELVRMILMKKMGKPKGMAATGPQSLRPVKY